MRCWSVESALGNRQVVTKLANADDLTVRSSTNWLVFRNGNDGSIVGVFSQHTLLSAVITEYEAEATVKRFRDSELLGKVNDLGISGIFAAFTDIDDAIEQMTSYIKEVSGE